MPLKTIKLAVSNEMLTQLDNQAQVEGMPRSEFIRRTHFRSTAPPRP